MRPARTVGGRFETVDGSDASSSRGASHDKNVAVAPQGQAGEGIARARAGGAVAGGWLVERAVRGADQRAPVLGEELVRPQVERRADVRAAIDIRVVFAAVIDDESLDAAAATLEPELRRPAGRQRGGGTAPLRRGRHAPHVTIHL